MRFVTDHYIGISINSLIFIKDFCQEHSLLINSFFHLHQKEKMGTGIAAKIARVSLDLGPSGFICILMLSVA